MLESQVGAFPAKSVGEMTSTQPSVEYGTPRIRLWEALGETLQAIENAAGVPYRGRIGFSGPSYAGCTSQGPFATGRTYVQLVAGGQYPYSAILDLNSNTSIVRERGARVASIPDLDELDALVTDSKVYPNESSDAELRLVRCHGELMLWLQSGQMRAWGDLKIEPPGQWTTGCGRLEIPSGWWSRAVVNYRGPFCDGSNCSGSYDFTDLASTAWRDGGDYSIGGIEASGRTSFANIDVDFTDFQTFLRNLIHGKTIIELQPPTLGQAKIWVVKVGNVQFEVDATKKSGLSRGLKSLAVLFRHPEVDVPFHLLESLDRRIVDTIKPSNPELRKFERKIQEGIDAIGKALYQRAVTVEEARTQLIAYVRTKAVEATTQLDSDIRNFGHEMAATADALRGDRITAPDWMLHVGETARKAIRDALKTIDRDGKEKLPNLGAALLPQLDLAASPYTVAYRPGVADPAWKVI